MFLSYHIILLDLIPCNIVVFREDAAIACALSDSLGPLL